VSPTWKAIEHGLKLVKKGIIWCIRSGTEVNIWRDPWIPIPKTTLVQDQSQEGKKPDPMGLAADERQLQRVG
jgi:hypothetical protein